MVAGEGREEGSWRSCRRSRPLLVILDGVVHLAAEQPETLAPRRAMLDVSVGACSIKHAPSRPSAIAMSSGRPSGLQLIRVYHGSIMGILGGPRRRRDLSSERLRAASTHDQHASIYGKYLLAWNPTS